MAQARRVLAVAVAAAALAGCAGSGGRDTSPPVAGSSSSTDVPRPSSTLAPTAERWVVVGRPTDAQLDLTTAEARRIVQERPDRWRGQRVSVVPLEEVGPTQVVARVAGVDPVRDDPDALEVTVVGDLMLTRGVPDAAAALAPMSALLRRADVTVGNLESTLSRRGAPTQGGDSFGGSSTLLEPLRVAGFDALSLANNHTGDFGAPALLDTVAALRRSPMQPFGAGRDVGQALRPAIVERDGVHFGFLGFNAIGETPRAERGSPGALSVRMPPRTGPLVRADLDRVLTAVRRTARQADVVVVLPHWGTQYTHTPEPVQRQVGRALVRAGADLVVGGHPHWVQGVDAVGGVPVLHSLGNYVFDMDFMRQTMQGVVLQATFWGPRLKAIRLLPYEMDAGTFAPRRVAGAAATSILGGVWGSSSGPFRAR